jgi:endonuclease/exonuclease/phosphatase family metal-dependent hydrolase
MLVVGTWNLENLFRPGQDGGPTSQAVYEAKLDKLASVIEAIAPDVLAVQEVGQPEALDDLVGRLSGTWHTAVSDFPDRRGIRVGFLSRLPLTDVQQVKDFPAELRPIQTDDAGNTSSRMGRGALRVRVERDGHTVDLVSCHLKSKLLQFPAAAAGRSRFQPHDEGERARYGAYALDRRGAEAATVGSYATTLLDGHGGDRWVVVLGDLNDEAEAATTQMLLGPPGSQFGTAGAGRADRGDASRLWNLAPLIPEEDRYSRIFEGRKELIDHILVSRALADDHTAVTVHHQGIQSIGPNPTERRDARGSDHDPVVAHLAP